MEQPFAATRYRLGTTPPGRVTVVFQGRVPLRARSRDDRIVPRLPAEESRIDPRRRFHALTIVRSGTATVRERGGRIRAIATGDLLTWTDFCAADRALEPGPGFSEASLSIDAATGRHLAAIGLWRSGPDIAAIGDPEPLAAALRALARAIEDPSLDDAELLRRAIAACARCHAAVDAQRDSFAVRACTLLADHPDPGFAIADAARRLELAPDAFRKRFRAEVGVPPGAWHLRRRMERALELLRGHGVAETAALLGYPDAFQFSRQFRRIVGIPPSRAASGAG